MLAKYAKSTANITMPTIVATTPTTNVKTPIAANDSTIEPFAALTLEWQAIKKQNQDLLTELAANSKRHAKDIEKRKSDHDAELATQAQRHQCAVDHLKRQHSVELDQVRVRHAADSAAQARTVRQLKKEIERATADKQAADNRLSLLNDRFDKLRRVHDATLDALHTTPKP